MLGKRGVTSTASHWKSSLSGVKSASPSWVQRWWWAAGSQEVD